jgi:hypothetical protein
MKEYGITVVRTYEKFFMIEADTREEAEIIALVKSSNMPYDDMCGWDYEGDGVSGGEG